MPADTAKYILHIADTSPENIEVIDFSGSDAVSSLYEFNINVRMSGAAKASKATPLALISLVALVAISVTVSGCGHPWLAGITYPKKIFKFPPKCNGGCPPSAAGARLKAGAAYPQAIELFLDQSDNDSKIDVSGTIFVNKPYKVLHVKELRYEWEGNSGIFAKERSIGLVTDMYVTENGWYWYNSLGNFFECDFFKCNFAKLFVGKEPGDVFKLRLELVYSFDDEPENMQTLEYNVRVLKGEYTPLFFGFS